MSARWFIRTEEAMRHADDPTTRDPGEPTHPTRRLRRDPPIARAARDILQALAEALEDQYPGVDRRPAHPGRNAAAAARGCYRPSLQRTVNRSVMSAYRDRDAGGATMTASISDRATRR